MEVVTQVNAHENLVTENIENLSDIFRVSLVYYANLEITKYFCVHVLITLLCTWSAEYIY